MMAAEIRVETDDVYEFVRAYLARYREDPHITPSQVAEHFNIATPTAFHHLKKLVEGGQLTKDAGKAGKYALPLAEPWEKDVLGCFAKATSLQEVLKLHKEDAGGLTPARLRHFTDRGLLERIGPAGSSAGRPDEKTKLILSRTGCAVAGRCPRCREPWGDGPLEAGELEDPGGRNPYGATVEATHLACRRANGRHRPQGVACDACGLHLHQPAVDLPAISIGELVDALDDVESRIIERLISSCASMVHEVEPDEAARFYPFELVVERLSVTPAGQEALTAGCRMWVGEILEADLAQRVNVDRLVRLLAAFVAIRQGMDWVHTKGPGLALWMPVPVDQERQDEMVQGPGPAPGQAGMPMEYYREDDLSPQKAHDLRQMRAVRDADFSPDGVRRRQERIWQAATELERSRKRRAEQAFDRLVGPAGTLLHLRRERDVGDAGRLFLEGRGAAEGPPSSVVVHRAGHWYHPYCTPAAAADGTTGVKGSEGS